jgi:hypothetical protein
MSTRYVEVIFTGILSNTLPKILNNMRNLKIFILSVCLITPIYDAFTQDQQARIDSLVHLLKSAGREWNDYAKPLIDIGEPAVPYLIEVAEDKSLSQWNRRIAVMTLNEIHSPLWKEPALNILFDRSENPGLRNQVTAGLKGFELSDVKEELWRIYQEVANKSYKLNIAYLLMTADTSMAYRSCYEIYKNYDGYVQKTALLNLVRLRPEESTTWFLNGLQIDDWMTANMAMDSLVASRYFVTDELIALYNKPDVREEVRWRIVFIFGHRNVPESVPLLLEAFQEESWLVHTEAAVGLCRFNPEQVIPKMKDLNKDSRAYVRNNSRWVIYKMKDR